MRYSFRDFIAMLKHDRMLMILVIILLIQGPVSSLIWGGVGGLMDWIIDLLLYIPALLIGLSFHEFAHAKVAVLCGDDTPLYQGRVTLNPSAHIDPMGLISMFFLHFGWGKPVMINPMNFRNRRRAGILVGLAGISMNLLVAVSTGILTGLLLRVFGEKLFMTSVGSALWDVLLNIIVLNVSLMLFNLLPIPPLDGYNVLGDLLNVRNAAWYKNLYYNSRHILLIAIILDIPSRLLSMPVSAIVGGIIDLIFAVGGL